MSGAGCSAVRGATALQVSALQVSVVEVEVSAEAVVRSPGPVESLGQAPLRQCRPRGWWGAGAGARS